MGESANLDRCKVPYTRDDDPSKIRIDIFLTLNNSECFIFAVIYRELKKFLKKIVFLQDLFCPEKDADKLVSVGVTFLVISLPW